MRPLLFIFLAAIPLLEIGLLVQLGKTIGLWWTLALVVATAAGGTFVLHRQGFAIINRVAETMAAGKPPVAPVIDGGFLMMAGMLLIMPGLISDALGLLLLIPQLRHAVAAWSVRKLYRSMTVRTTTFQQRQTQSEAPWPGERQKEHPTGNPHDQAQTPGEGPVIDGEFERLDERTLDARRRANGSAHPDTRH